MTIIFHIGRKQSELKSHSLCSKDAIAFCFLWHIYKGYTMYLYSILCILDGAVLLNFIKNVRSLKTACDVLLQTSTNQQPVLEGV